MNGQVLTHFSCGISAIVIRVSIWELTEFQLKFKNCGAPTSNELTFVSYNSIATVLTISNAYDKTFLNPKIIRNLVHRLARNQIFFTSNTYIVSLFFSTDGL